MGVCLGFVCLLFWNFCCKWCPILTFFVTLTLCTVRKVVIFGPTLLGMLTLNKKVFDLWRLLEMESSRSPFCILQVLSCFTQFLAVSCGRGRYRSGDLGRKNVKSLQGVGWVGKGSQMLQEKGSQVDGRSRGGGFAGMTDCCYFLALYCWYFSW